MPVCNTVTLSPFTGESMPLRNKEIKMTVKETRAMLATTIAGLEKLIREMEEQHAKGIQEYEKTQDYVKTETITVTEAIDTIRNLTYAIATNEIGLVVKEIGMVINNTPFLRYKGYDKVLALEGIMYIKKIMETNISVLKEMSDKLVEDKHSLDSH